MARKRGMQYIPYDYEAAYNKAMVKDRDSIPEILKKWYPDMDFTNAKVYYNDFNCMFYIHARMRKRRLTGEKTDKTDKTGIEKSRFV